MGTWEDEYFLPLKGPGENMHEMPPTVANAFGLAEFVVDRDELTQAELAKFNDGGERFSYIADVIETFTEAGL
jgi:hypothetical protein